MSKMAELDWEIEYRACDEGMSAEDIAKDLNCPIELVNAWFKGAGIWDEEASPYATINS
jgi:hypothetical protein